MAAYERRSTWRVTRRVGLWGFRQDAEKIHLMGINFGPGGLRVESPRRFRLQEDLMLRVPPKGEDKSKGLDDSNDVRVKVVWVKKRKDYPTFDVGLQFTGNETDNARLAARFLLDDCGVTIRNPKEKRKAPRALVDKMSAIFSTRDGSMVNAGVIDLSVGGALLQSPRNVPAGEAVSVKIILAKDIPSLDCKATVIRSRPGTEPRTFALGIQFSQVPEDHKDRLVKFLSRQLKMAPAP
jgi:hypothetical protein